MGPPLAQLNTSNSAFDVDLESSVWRWPWGYPQLGQDAPE